MCNKFAAVLLATCLLVWTTGCIVSTTGMASWEVYSGVRTTQHGEEPASVEVESGIVDAIVDSFTDGEISEAE